jgi:hypothetical protein
MYVYDISVLIKLQITLFGYFFASNPASGKSQYKYVASGAICFGDGCPIAAIYFCPQFSEASA